MLSIIGAATLIAGVHSLFLPIAIERESTGFVIPDDPLGSEPASAGDTTATETPPALSPGDAQGSSSSGAAVVPSGLADETDPSSVADEEPADGKIDLATATTLHERSIAGRGVWFLDARRREDYDAGRVQGALFMEHSYLSGGEGLDELMMLTPPEMGELLVIYCTGGDCQASEDTAILLEQAGYTNIAIMEVGYDAWAAAGLPTEGP